MKADLADLLRQLPGKVTPQWPQGERFVRAFAHGTMTVEVYAPAGHDPQTPHGQDELYFVQAGTGEFVVGSERHAFGPGTVLFVPAGVPHRFLHFTPDFVTWVVFWGPPGGEGDAGGP